MPKADNLRSKRQSNYNTGVIIGPSNNIPGELGVLAVKKFKPKQFIFEVRGPVLSTRTKYSFQIGTGQHIDPFQYRKPTFGHYLNHSCDPNAFTKIVKNRRGVYIKVFARRLISPGDEVATDYAIMEYDLTISGSRCFCGTKKCRGIITGFNNLSKKDKQNYIDEGIVPDYLTSLNFKNN